MDEAFADDKAKAGTTVGAGGGGVDLAEDLEEEIHLVVRDADAGVLDREMDFPDVAGLGRDGFAERREDLAGNLEGNFAAVGELDGVADEVEDDLAQALVVADEAGGEIVVDDVDEVEVLLARLRGKEVDRLLDAGAQVEGIFVELEPASLDLGEVEDVVDDGEERFAAGAEGLDVVVLGGVELGLEQEAGHADDAVHGRADFVAHVGEELALGAVAGLGHVAGLDELLLVLDALGDVARGQGVHELAFDLGAVEGDLGGEAAALARDGLGLDEGERGGVGLAAAKGALAGLVEEAGRGEEAVEGLALEVLELVLPEARGLAVHGEDLALLVGGDDGLADGVDDGGEAALGGEQLVVLGEDHADHGPDTQTGRRR